MRLGSYYFLPPALSMAVDGTDGESFGRQALQARISYSKEEGRDMAVSELGRITDQRDGNRK